MRSGGEEEGIFCWGTSLLDHDREECVIGDGRVEGIDYRVGWLWRWWGGCMNLCLLFFHLVGHCLFCRQTMNLHLDDLDWEDDMKHRCLRNWCLQVDSSRLRQSIRRWDGGLVLGTYHEGVETVASWNFVSGVDWDWGHAD